LGTPEQAFKVYLHPLFENLIVIDEECGKPLIPKCPKYCQEVSIKFKVKNFKRKNSSAQFQPKYSMYCNEDLCGFTDQAIRNSCRMKDDMSFIFNASKSKTFKSVEKGIWRHQTVNIKPLVGTYGTDKMRIPDVNNAVLSVDNFMFVRGRLMDKRLEF
jgi:hypothetical protein